MAVPSLKLIHVDHLHRPIMMTDAGRANVWWAAYEPYGQVRATGGTLTQNLQLPGQWFQLETGLAYNWHRHYDPSIGRYTTPDPLGFVDGPSLFAYAGGAPQRAVDPSGLGTPLVSTPNSGQWVSSKTYRLFGPDGRAFCDFDFPGTHGLLETNNWSWNGNRAKRGPTKILIPQ